MVNIKPPFTPVLVDHQQTASRKGHNNKRLGPKGPSQTNKYCITLIIGWAVPLVHYLVSPSKHIQTFNAEQMACVEHNACLLINPQHMTSSPATAIALNLGLPSQVGLCHQNTNNQAFSTDLISTNWSIASNAQLGSRPLKRDNDTSITEDTDTGKLILTQPFHIVLCCGICNTDQTTVQCSSILVEWDSHEGLGGGKVSSKCTIRHQGASSPSSPFIDSFTI